jgi:hypothetical protein
MAQRVGDQYHHISPVQDRAATADEKATDLERAPCFSGRYLLFF